MPFQYDVGCTQSVSGFITINIKLCKDSCSPLECRPTISSILKAICFHLESLSYNVFIMLLVCSRISIF